MSLERIGVVAKTLGVPVNTVRNWTNTGKLKVSHISESGHRYYDMKEVEAVANRAAANLVRRTVRQSLNHDITSAEGCNE